MYNFSSVILFPYSDVILVTVGCVAHMGDWIGQDLVVVDT